MDNHYHAPLTARVTKITEQTRLEGNSQPLTYMHIEFYVGTHGPFYRDVLKSSFDPVAVKAQLDAYAQSLNVLVTP